MTSFNKQFARKLKHIPDNEEIVVTGISGRYPESKSIEVFARRLYNNEDMVKEDITRWRKDMFQTPMGMGKLNDLEMFDAEFFGYAEDEPDSMAAQLRFLLETTYEAIWDSGCDPNSLSGSKTGVFIGNCFDETLNAHSSVGTIPSYKDYLASSLSDRFNLKGPAMACDTACASSFTALNEAVTYMRHNLCDSAIVAGINLGLNPLMQYQFLKLNMLSPDGKCKCLDESANGYAKGEAVVAIFLQRKPSAKRIYATIIHTKTNNDGYEEMGITFPTWESQRDLMRAAYAEAGVNPHNVHYIEAHCTGTQAGDPEEMRAICESMCSGDRKQPILIGAHKSNIGHTEAASGLCAMSKVIISLENELIPANIHFKKPNPKIEGITRGLLKPVNENTPFFGDLVGVNNFGFGGSNIHVIIKSPKIKPKVNNRQIVDKIPRLVTMCGRNEESIEYFFEQLFDKPEQITRDLLALINDISKTSPFKGNVAYNGMTSRGFAIIKSREQNLKEINSINVNQINEKDREVWFVLSGMGTQWTAMAKDLIKIDVFEKSIRNLCEIIKRFSIDLWDLLINEKQNICDSVMNSFLTIAAIQIALIDLLEYLDIKPNGIIGHSIGELTCAYADKCLTAEETICMAYWRAKCIEDNPSTRGSMAAIGLGAKDAENVCPLNVFIACDNADDSVTVAGDQTTVEEFVKQLKAKEIFAANVESSGIAFHSPLLYSVGEDMALKLTNIMPNTRKMTSHWISSNFNIKSKNISAQYFVDNLLYPIRFNESVKQIPRNAIVIEVSPHCLLQSIIKRSLGPNISYVPLMRKNDNNINLLLSSIGTLYTLGLNPKIEELYPRVEFPVSNGTKFISPLIKWIHNKKYVVTTYPEYFSVSQSRATRRHNFNLMDKEDQYITGHIIDGRNLYPGTGYLLHVWKHLASFNNTEYDELAVEFRDVVFHRATILQQNRELNFQTTIDSTNGNFVLLESDALVVTGNISILKKGLEYQYYLDENSYRISKQENFVLRKQEIYNSLRLRGYDYKQSFQCISEAYVEDRCVKALLDWTDNWVVFVDNMIQIGIIGIDTKGLYIPTRLDVIRFDPKLLLSEVSAMGQNPRFEAIFDYDTRIGVTKGVEYRNMKANLIQRNFNPNKILVGDYSFQPYEGQVIDEREDELSQYMSICDKLAQNLNKKLQLLRSVNKTAKIITHMTDNDTGIVITEKDRQLFELLTDLKNMEEFNVDVIKELDSFKELNEDFLLNTIYNKWLIDTQMITVYENKKVLELRTLELSDSQELIQPIVYESMDPHDYNIILKYFVCKRSADRNPTEENSNTIDWPSSDSTIPEVFKELDLIIYKNDSKDNIVFSELFQSVWDKLKSNGFFQIIFRDKLTESEKFIRNLMNQKIYTINKNQMRNEAEKCGFTYIGWNSNQFGANCLLFRKITTDPKVENQVFVEISNNFGDWLETLKDQIKTIHNKPEGDNIWLIAQKSAKNGILGLVYNLRKEFNGMRIRSIFDFNGNKQLLENKEELKDIIQKDLVFNVFKDNKWGAYKMNIQSSMVKTVLTKHAFLNTANRGDLSSLKWFECQHKYWPIGRKPDQMLVNVYYSALNFRDIMLASGRLPSDALPGDIALQDCILGLEFSGRDENGNRVMGMIPSKALATTCIVDDPDFLWPIPDNWTMEEASTVPCVYSTAYYSLIIRGNLKKGEKVLIHSGSGGVGQAAINICMDMDCQLFITVGAKEKREFLKKLFPKLTDRSFSSSRNLSFKNHVMNATNGKGVDLVLNSLSEDKLKASLECLANNGRFLEIGKYDMSVNTKIDMTEMIKNKSFHGILLDALFTTDENTPQTVLKDRKRIWDLISDGIKRGVVKPLNRSVFNIEESEEAFRFMSSGKHMGKVVIKIRDEEPEGPKITLSGVQITAIARTVFNPNKVYIITGGLGGFGLELIDWMIQREAKKFFITSRTGPKDGYQKMKLKQFQDVGGADIHIVSGLDLSLPKQATTLLNIGLKYGAIGGIFHLALVLADAIFANQTEELFTTVCRSKSDAFVILDIVSRKYCPDLDFFVGFSSGVGSRGNIGQTNYGFSNTIMDRVCELRKENGYSGLSIQWGVIGDVGIVVKNTGSDDAIIAGTVAQRMPSCLQIMDQLLHSSKAVCLSCVKSEPKLESGGGKGNFLKKLAHILGMDDIKKLDPSTKFLKLGMDSLMAVEIQLSIEREYGVVLSAQEVRELSIAKVLEMAQS